MSSAEHAAPTPDDDIDHEVNPDSSVICIEVSELLEFYNGRVDLVRARDQSLREQHTFPMTGPEPADSEFALGRLEGGKEILKDLASFLITKSQRLDGLLATWAEAIDTADE